MISCRVCGITNNENQKTTKCQNCKARLFVSDKLKKEAAETYKIGTIGLIEVLLMAAIFVVPALGLINGVTCFVIYIVRKSKLAWLFLLLTFVSLILWGILIDMAEAEMAQLGK